MRADRSTWKRLGPARYRVVDLVNGDVWDFEGSREVAMHMWGRLSSEYAIFKDRHRFVTSESLVNEFEKALEAFDPAKETT